jgi:hypothetical protein
MSEIKLNINAPDSVITIASSINAQQYIQSQGTEKKDSSVDTAPDLITEEEKPIKKVDEFDNYEDDQSSPNIISTTEKSFTKSSGEKRREKKEKSIPAFKDLIDSGIIEPKRIQITNICKKVFGKNNFYKDYALIYCLLLEKKLISCKRMVFFESWYNYLDKDFSNTFPDRNLTGLYNYIKNDHSKGDIFNDEYEKDNAYTIRKKNEFDDELRKKGLA